MFTLVLVTGPVNIAPSLGRFPVNKSRTGLELQAFISIVTRKAMLTSYIV